MRKNDFKNMLRKVFNNVYISEDNAGNLYMGLDPRSDLTVYPIAKATIDNIKDRYDFLREVLNYVHERKEDGYLQGNLLLETFDETFDNFDFNKWYPDEYTVDDGGVEGGTLNVYLGFDLIGTISGENASKPQPYLYIEPMKNAEACNIFTIKCHEIWLANQSNGVVQ